MAPRSAPILAVDNPATSPAAPTQRRRFAAAAGAGNAQIMSSFECSSRPRQPVLLALLIVPVGLVAAEATLFLMTGTHALMTFSAVALLVPDLRRLKSTNSPPTTGRYEQLAPATSHSFTSVGAHS
jgi:hypothetical protein